MVASSSQPSGSGHAPIESERTSAATFPGVQENHRLAGNRPSSNNQSVSFFFPMLFSPTTYLTTRHDSPSTSFSFLLLLSLTLRLLSFLRPSLLRESGFLSVFTDAAWIFQIWKRGGTVGGTVATLIFHLEKVVGRRWEKGGLGGLA